MTADNTPQDAPPADQTPPATGDAPDEGRGGKEAVLADLAKERAERKKAQKELEQLRAAQTSETEKAIAEAEARGRAAATADLGGLLVEETLRALTANRSLKPDALFDFDRVAFLGDDGRPKRDELAQWVEKHSVAADPAPRFGGIDQGVRTPPSATDGDERTFAKTLFGGTT